MATIHLINPMRNPAGGSEHRTMALFSLLSEVEEVNIWSEEEPHPDFAGRVPIRRISPGGGFPKGGNFVFIGTYFSIGQWIQVANPNRIVLVHNLDQPDRLRQVWGSVKIASQVIPEVVFASASIATSTSEIVGRIEESPIDLHLFCPGEPSSEFIVGRLSRDVPEKHHPGDPFVYCRLAAEGVKVRLMGATCLNLNEPSVELLTENSEPPDLFLRSLSCFFYRTHPAWKEAFGRVVFEALATGLPVVAEDRHGYSEKLTDTKEAMFVGSDEEAVQAILALKSDANMRARLGLQGRKTVEGIYGSEYQAEMRAYYSR